MKQGSGCRREHKPFGTVVFLTKQPRCTPSSPEDLLWASDHKAPRRSVPKPPQVTCTPSPTQVRRWNKYSANLLGVVGFVRSPGKNHGCSIPWFRRSHDVDRSFITPSARSDKYLCLRMTVLHEPLLGRDRPDLIARDVKSSWGFSLVIARDAKSCCPFFVVRCHDSKSCVIGLCEISQSLTRFWSKTSDGT